MASSPEPPGARGELVCAYLLGGGDWVPVKSEDDSSESTFLRVRVVVVGTPGGAAPEAFVELSDDVSGTLELGVRIGPETALRRLGADESPSHFYELERVPGPDVLGFQFVGLPRPLSPLSLSENPRPLRRTRRPRRGSGGGSPRRSTRRRRRGRRSTRPATATRRRRRGRLSMMRSSRGSRRWGSPCRTPPPR